MNRPFKRSPQPSTQQEETPKRNQMLIGMRPLQEAIAAGKEFDKVLLQRGLQGEVAQAVKLLLQQEQIPYQLVPAEKLARITTKNHQGIIAFVSPITYGNLDNIIQELFAQGTTPRLLMLDSVTDVRNFGAICRTAECFGVHAVIVPEKGSAQINEEAIKTSAGALYNIPICRVRSLSYTINNLRQSGITVVACSEKTRKESYEVDLTNPLCVIMGSEESGISADLLKISDDIMRIPMSGKTTSLNVSVAAGIALYEIIRQSAVEKA
ncbi:MAG: 23S rRNA (guanosine(2251)-2'-O)-methyltransferase RlmB [Flavobacteriales bacterium]